MIKLKIFIIINLSCKFKEKIHNLYIICSLSYIFIIILCYNFYIFFFSIALLSLLITIGVSTVYETELSSGGTSTFRSALLCFSLRRNLRSVLQINYSNPGLDCIHLIRLVLSLIVLNGHRAHQYYANPTSNIQHFEDVSIAVFFMNIIYKRDNNKYF